jgi:hypothetical protein
LFHPTRRLAPLISFTPLIAKSTGHLVLSKFVKAQKVLIR